MTKLLILRGLPASGKSTYAKELALKPDWKRVNRDDLRSMIDSGKWSKANEEYITKIELTIAQIYVNQGLNIVVDDTNLSPKAQKMWNDFASDHNINNIEERFFDTPVEECIERDLVRPNSVGSKVIMRMYHDYLAPHVEPYRAPQGAPKAIIVDVDGTAAHMAGRGPYDPTKYSEDTPDKAVRDIVNTYASQDYDIIFCSGRDDTYRDVTMKWLTDNGFGVDFLWMRPAGDTRNDAVVKLELFDRHIRDKFDIEFVLDDRDRVVQAWRSIGLKCLQVAEGDF